MDKCYFYLLAKDLCLLRFFLSECNFLWFVFTDCTISEVNLIVLLLYTLETLPYKACKSQNPHTVLTGNLCVSTESLDKRKCVKLRKVFPKTSAEPKIFSWTREVENCVEKRGVNQAVVKLFFKNLFFLIKMFKNKDSGLKWLLLFENLLKSVTNSKIFKFENVIGFCMPGPDVDLVETIFKSSFSRKDTSKQILGFILTAVVIWKLQWPCLGDNSILEQ